MSDHNGLPRSIEIAWGLRETPTKGPRRGLSLEKIVESAIAIAETDGLAAVSMARVADALDVGTMSLYRYVAAKDELLILMTDAALGELPEQTEDNDGWRAGLERLAWALFAVYRRHPWVLRVPLSGPPITPNQLAWMERGLAALRDSGLPERDKLPVMLVLTGFVRSEAVVASDIAARGGASASAADADPITAYGRTLSRLVTPERFPSLTAAMASSAEVEDEGPDQRFSFGLARVLDGIEALVRQHMG